MLRGITAKATRLASWNRASRVFIPVNKEFLPFRSCSTALNVDDEAPSSPKTPFRIHRDFAFDPEKDSLIKPIWRSEETEEELIWRAQLLLGLLKTMEHRSIKAYSVDVRGVTGMERRPVEIAQSIYRVALKKDSLMGITSNVYRHSPDVLRILFASMDAKHEFLRAAPAINRLKNTFNDGQTLQVRMTEYTKEEVETGQPIKDKRPIHPANQRQALCRVVGYRDFNRGMFLNPEFEIKRNLLPKWATLDSAKAWIELLESRLRNYVAQSSTKTISFDVEGSIEPYEKLNGIECAKIGEKILTSLSANSYDFESFSYLSVHNPFHIGKGDFEKSIVLEFRGISARNRVRRLLGRVRTIHDPLNPWKNLRLRDTDRRSVKEHTQDVEEDVSLGGLTRRLNLVENALQVESYNEYVKKYRIDITSESELEGLRDPQNREEEARRIFGRAFKLEPKFVDRLSLETFLASASGRFPCWLEINIQKRWQAEYMRIKYHQTKSYELEMVACQSSMTSHAKMMAAVVKAYLEKEKGVESAIYVADYGVPYLVTADEDGGRSWKLFNRFGLTKEDVDRYSPPGAQWGSKTSAVGTSTLPSSSIE